MKKKLSINDIAKQLKVSATTISFILNGRAEEKRISAQLVERVQKFIQEVGYAPNSLARSLRTGKSYIIGLMVENIANPFFANIARLIEERAYQNGYKIIYCSTDNDTRKTRELIRMFRERHVDGYIIAPPEGVTEEINALINDGLPVILFDRRLAQVATACVVIDNEQSMYHAVEHLHGQGFRHIAFITLDSGQSQMQERLMGYQKAISQHALQPHILQLAFSFDTENTIREVSAFLQKEPQVDAVVFATNYLGISGIKAIRQLDKQLATDIGVIAFDDHDLFSLTSPGITAISQPIEEMAEKMITLLLSKLDTDPEAHTNETVTLQTRLVVRESSIHH